MTVAEAFALALEHFRAGRLAESETFCRQVLAAAPEHPDALQLLGILASQAGRFDLAAPAFQRAAAVMPDVAAIHFNLGTALRRLGRNEDAAAAYRRALQLDPRDPATHNNLGNALRDLARLDESAEAFREAIRLRSDFVEAHNNLGNVLREKGEVEEAIAEFRRALALKPDYAEAWSNLGDVLRDVSRGAEAIAAFRRALALRPDFAPALSHLGCVLAEQGRMAEGHEACRRAAGLDPGSAEFRNNLGAVLYLQGRHAEAIEAYRQALRIRPGSTAAHNNLGNALAEMRRLDEAVAEFRRAIEFSPDFAAARGNLGNALRERGEIDAAVESYRCALALAPESADLHSNLVYTALFHPGYDAVALRAECAAWDARHGALLAKRVKPHGNDRDPERRLRVGYVSPDFWHHVICHFLTPLLEAHDHAQCEVFCYASVQRPDAITARLRRRADVWRDVLGLGDEALAEQIRADGIDVLVDLTQHMADNRLPVFARRPAPVQVAWLGYPGSTGLRAMDYRLTDAQMEPPGAAWSESVETPVRLPDSWFCYDPIDDFPAPGGLPALREGCVTFGCLNNFCKLNEAVLERWARVLRAAAGSRLLLRCPEGTAQARVRAFFAERGIAEERLELVAWTATRAEFYELFGRIDVALDPFPYNGGTTTCEALWMGIPVLTLPGEGIVSRIGLSILSAAGMREFVAENEEEYVRLAVELAGDLPRLAQHRATLRGRMAASPFMDAPRFARNIEAAYRGMWRAWCAKQSASESR